MHHAATYVRHGPSGSISVWSVYGVRGGIRCASHYRFVSPYPSHSSAGKQPCVHTSTARPALRAFPLTHTSTHCEQSSACSIYSHRNLGYHKKRCGHRPCARSSAIGNEPFASTASRKALWASQALRATLCVLSSSTKGSLHIRNGQVPHIRTSTAGKHPARAQRCGQTPCVRPRAAGQQRPARNNNTSRARNRLSDFSPEKKPGKGQERQLGERGGTTRTRRPLTPRALPPPLAQDVRGQGDRAHPRRHARLA
jgi:hypothetical protein